jgi:hypothetical protein
MKARYFAAFARGGCVMTRLSAGFLTGVIGALLVAVTTALFTNPFLSLLIAIGAGLVAGILVGRNPRFSGKTGGAGALAALIAGGCIFVGGIIAGVLFLNSSTGQSIVSQVAATVTVTAQPGNGSSGGAGGSGVSATQITQVAVVALFCFLGILNLGLSTAAGAIAGAIAGRNSTPPPQMPPQGMQYNPYSAPYPPTGYPPPQAPLPGYGTQQAPPASPPYPTPETQPPPYPTQ